MDKFFAKSKTIQGIVLMLLPQLDELLGTDWLATLGPGIDTAMTALLTAAGAILGIIGRVRAKGRITL